MRFRTGAAVLLLASWCSAANSAPTAAQPQVDLGQTSFLDGEAGPGWLIETIGNGTVARYSTDGAGHALSGVHRQWTASVTLHPAFIASETVLGAHPGIEFLFPAGAVHLDLPGQPSTTQGGVGDITVAPLLQWNDGRLLGRPFAIRAALQLVLPGGTYSPGREVSLGQNALQVSPYAAFTVRVTPEWEMSGRLIYDWSSPNARPARVLGADSSQAGGQAVLNVAASRALSANWRLGVAGYGLRQISSSRVDQEVVHGSEQRALAAGPGFEWSDEHGSTLIGTLYREFSSRNRPEGFNAVLRLLLTF